MKFACKMPQKTTRITAAPAVMYLEDASTRGFTLIELLVYMAIMGFIIVVAGRAFSDSTKMRVRSQNMLASAEEAGRVSALLKEDISQMGAKSFGRSSASGIVFDTVAGVHWNYNAKDFSSYNLERNNPANDYDYLSFRKAYYDPNGVCGAVLAVEWYVRAADSVLMRKCTSTRPAKCATVNNFDADQEKCATNGTTLEIARNVVLFKLNPSIPGIIGSSYPSATDTLYSFSSTNANPFSYRVNSTGTPAAYNGKVLSGVFSVNSSSSGTQHTDFYIAGAGGNNCQSFTFNAGEEYAIRFQLLYKVNSSDPCRTNANCTVETSIAEKYNRMAMFQANRDHLSIGLRNPTTYVPINGISDFLFYPPQDDIADNVKTRLFRFSVPENTPACVGITAAFYSPEAYKGHLDIDSLKVYRKTDEIYHFERSSGSNYNPSSASAKAQVKAFELSLGINKKGEINRTTTVIPVPNNGLVSGGN